MALIVKNTFLHVAGDTLEVSAKPSTSGKRSCSLPRNWKPMRPKCECDSDGASCFSARSEVSFSSIVEASGSSRRNFGVDNQLVPLNTEQSHWHVDSAVCDGHAEGIGVDKINSCSWNAASYPSTPSDCTTSFSSTSSLYDASMQYPDQDQMSIFGPSYCTTSAGDSTQWNCTAPISLAGPRIGWSQTSGNERNETDPVPWCLPYCDTAFRPPGDDFAEETGMDDQSHYAPGHDMSCMECSSTSFINGLASSCSLAADCFIADGTANYEEALTSLPLGAASNHVRTVLRSAAPAFEPLPRIDCRIDAVTSAIQLALVSSGQVESISLEKDPGKPNHSTIVGKVRAEDQDTSSSYSLVQLAKRSVEALSEHISSLYLLSARIQKDSSDAYGLRLNIAGLPEGKHEELCWDLCNHGHCPRRASCRWHHPRDSDVFRIKVIIRKAGEDYGACASQEASNDKSTERQHISLGELI